jgi:8-oxo-dGTP diphosphatase
MTHVHVAVGVIHRNQKILLSRRHQDSHQGGLWEFPGGKVEQDEGVQVALDRELREELGIGVVSCEPLLEVRHDYGDKQVLLDVWWVSRYSGEETGLEGQPLLWADSRQLSELAFPAANKPIVDAVILRLQGTC